MLIIGSQAGVYHGLINRKPLDTDIICIFDSMRKYISDLKKEKGIIISQPLDESHWHVRTKDGHNYEFEVAWPGSSGEDLLLSYNNNGIVEFADATTLLALKLSHRYKKNSPHFLKTMRDIQYFRSIGVELDDWHKEWLVKREAETYTYAHPKLDVSKGDFFKGDGVNYVYDHDTIHEAVALIWDSHPMGLDCYPHPAYKFYMQDGAAVMTDKQKFFTLPEQVRLYGVYEESCVLALERSQIPYDFSPSPRWSFETALMKVCTSITSGWFREYAWENYDKVIDLYNELGENDYIERFNRNRHLLKPFNTEKGAY